MILMTGIGIYLGISGLGLWQPVLTVLTLGVFFAQNWLLLLLALRFPLPGRWGIVRALAVCLTLAIVIGIGGDASYTRRYEVAYLLLIPASLASWLLLPLLVWLFRQTSFLPDRQAVRRVAAIHLLIEAIFLVVALVALGAPAARKSDDWRWSYYDSGAAFLAVLANAVPIVLWLSLFSPWRNVPKRAWPDALFRWCMIVALGIAIPSCLAMLYLALNHDRLDEYYSSRGEYTLFWYEITTALVFGLPQMVSSALFASGTTCQLFRRHQDRLLIALGCLYFIPFWLFLLLRTARFP